MSEPTPTPNATAATTTDTPNIESTLGLSGVDLIAMLVSDSGLASCEPKWWNASPNGCMLIGLQPRGGWQIVQRAVQWGSDSWANCFGVDCAPPTLYAYFACSIRNRLEMLDTPRLRSPMEGVTTAGAPWRVLEDGKFSVKRPTKLIDGSRGGQAFIARVLGPEGGTHYSIADQSRVQMVSVLMVGAGLVKKEEDEGVEGFMGRVVPRDFDLDSGLGSVFARLAVGLGLASLVSLGMMIATWWSLVRENLFGVGLPYVVKVVALMCWGTGAMGLLMLGGNPRVEVVTKKIPKHTQKKLDALRNGVEVDPEAEQAGEVEADLTKVLSSSTLGSPDAISPTSPGSTTTGLDHGCGQATRPRLKRGSTAMSGTTLQVVPSITATPEAKRELEETDGEAEKASDAQHVIVDRDPDPRVKIEFGSLHGSVFVADRGFCMLRMSVIERLCATDIRTARTRGWYVGMGWYGILLLGSIALQVGATLAPAFGADLLSLVFLLASALARGAGVAGPEKWMIPRWKRRDNAANGAVLLGQFDSRVGASEV